MAVVIRLQGLRMTAGSEDIRKFFTGLKIPDGGVHIIGGDHEEAFIIFASDEDARRAMTRSGGFIKGSPISLLLSSKSEMQSVLERSTKNAELDQNRRLEENARHGRRSVDPEVGRRLEQASPPQHQWESNADDIYVFLRGMPFSVTEAEIYEFFSGLYIDEIILLKNPNGTKNGKGFAKFASSGDVSEALKRDRNYIGARYVEVSTATAEDWGKVAARLSITVNNERERSPIRSQRIPQLHPRSQSPLAPRSMAPPNDDYCVILENLSFAVEKDDIKMLFNHAKLEDDQILHLLDGDEKRTRSTFVLFKSLRDYCGALTPDKRLFYNRWVYTRPISREKMIALLQSQSQSANNRPGKFEKSQEMPPPYSTEDHDFEKVCLFVRNLPFDVRKVEIMDFFLGFDVAEDKVYVLRDHKGAGVGKAVIVFRTEAEAMSACSLRGRRFLGSEVILKCISRTQMRQLGVEPPVAQEAFVREPLPKEEHYSGRSGQAFQRSGDTQHPDMRTPHDGNMSMPDMQSQFRRGRSHEACSVGQFAPKGNGVRGNFGSQVQGFDESTCVQLVNLPFQIRNEEIYDFCYGYRVIPGSVSLQYHQGGRPKGSATIVFESYQEALTAIRELSGRSIGPRKIQLLVM
ncbi:RNA binding motif protein 12Bb [Brachionichthys hirsutus]|uniref:RNA binding motif protein 12Bb n=1 Tax=Brachionichthys hirsutus TaxID=412623 RepID=UPI0036045256